MLESKFLHFKMTNSARCFYIAIISKKVHFWHFSRIIIKKIIKNLSKQIHI